MGLGGSATNDGGAGLAQALGYRLWDAAGNDLPGGAAALARIAGVEDAGVNPLLAEAELRVACDVDNPLLGEQGASAVYGPQKGADAAMVKELDAALGVFADVVENWVKKPLRERPGVGAAGGLGFGLCVFCDARLESGIDTILDLTDFERHLKGADLVITGEGKIDGQSKRGKVPVGVAQRVRPLGLPVLAIVGDIDEGADAVYELGINAIMSTVDRAMSLETAVLRSTECLTSAAARAARMIKMGMGMG